MFLENKIRAFKENREARKNGLLAIETENLKNLPCNLSLRISCVEYPKDSNLDKISHYLDEVIIENKSPAESIDDFNRILIDSAEKAVKEMSIVKSKRKGSSNRVYWSYFFSIENLYGIEGVGSSGSFKDSSEIFSSASIFKNSLTTLLVNKVLWNHVSPIEEEFKKELLSSYMNNDIYEEFPIARSKESFKETLKGRDLDRYFDKLSTHILNIYKSSVL